jgi:hypothetical protein
MIGQCAAQVRAYLLDVAGDDAARAQAYHAALSPLLMRHALRRALGECSELFGGEAAPAPFAPLEKTDKAIRRLHEILCQCPGAPELPVFQSAEEIRRYAARLADAHRARTAPGAPEIVTCFPPAPTAQTRADLTITFHEPGENRKGRGWSLFGRRRRAPARTEIRSDRILYLNPVHEGGPLVVGGDVRIDSIPGPATIIASGAVRVGRIGGPAFIVAGRGIEVGEIARDAVLVSGRDADVKRIGGHARVYAEGHVTIDSLGGGILLRSRDRSLPRRAQLHHTFPQDERMAIFTRFTSVMDCIDDEPETLMPVRALFGRALRFFNPFASSKALDSKLAPAPRLAAPAPQAEQTLKDIFIRFAGREVLAEDAAPGAPDRDDPVLAYLFKTAALHGYTLRLHLPGDAATQEHDPRRINIRLEKSATHNKWRIAGDFGIY